MILAFYAAPIVNTMRKLLFFIIIPIAKGLDALLGVHNHQRIQHKDFATYLTGNVLICIYLLESSQTNIKYLVDINIIASLSKSALKDDSHQETIHFVMLLSLDQAKGRRYFEERLLTFIGLQSK